MRIVKGVVALLAAVIIGFAGWLYFAPPDLIRVGSHYSAKIVCSNVFLAGRDSQATLETDVQAPGHWLLRLMDVSVDRTAGEVRAGLLGIFGGGLSVYREGQGCAAVPDGDIEAVRARPAPPLSEIAAPGEGVWPEGETVEPLEDSELYAVLNDEALVGPGMRAVTIPVSAKTGVGGFVFPGDRVDMVLTQQVEGEGTALKASETILRNLRVLATDQSTVSEKAEDGSTVVKAFSTVTIEVTPVIAEKVAVAQTIGTLSLSLRSLADNQSELERAIASGDVAIPDNATPEEEEKLLREAMSRPDDGRSTYVTGGDVSRFQRRTAPSQGAVAAAAPQAVGGASQPVRRGPSVRVTRGKDTEDVSVGAAGVSAASSAFLGKQATGTAQAAKTVPAAQAVVIK